MTSIDLYSVVVAAHDAWVRLLRRFLLAGLPFLTTGALLAPVAPLPAAADGPSPGAPGAGDAYFPQDGNGGFRVSHYDARLHYQPGNGVLSGRTTVTIRATQALSRFDLDLQLPATAVRVDGERARFRQGAHELVVTPARPLARGAVAHVEVRYAGRPGDVTVDGGQVWRDQEDGGSFVNGEPHSGTVWLPLSDHPSDKASYDITVTVPRGWSAVAPGDLSRRRTTGASSTFRWRVADDMPSYQLFLGVGHYRFERGADLGTPTSLLAYSASFDAATVAKIRAQFHAQRGYLRWLERRLGRYPFRHLGMVVQDGEVATIESLSAPVYGSYVFEFGYPEQARSTILHELAHQWFGSSVTIRRWRDLWLNEGFASFVSGWYDAEHGGPSLDEQLRAAYEARPAGAFYWTVPPGDPGPGRRNLFRTVYTRGAMTLAALRHRIGASASDRLLRAWARQHRHGYGTTEQFVRRAEELGGQDLEAFFRTWLFAPERPEDTVANGL